MNKISLVLIAFFSVFSSSSYSNVKRFDEDHCYLKVRVIEGDYLTKTVNKLVMQGEPAMRVGLITLPSIQDLYMPVRVKAPGLIVQFVKKEAGEMKYSYSKAYELEAREVLNNFISDYRMAYPEQMCDHY